MASSILANAADADIIGTSSAMLWVCRLEARHKPSELRFVKPTGRQSSESARTFWGMKMFSTVQRVPREWRLSFAGDHQHCSQASLLRLFKKAQKNEPGLLHAAAMQVKSAVDFNLTSCQALGGTPVQPSNRWSWLLEQ
jgi:hypothetical protein